MRLYVIRNLDTGAVKIGRSVNPESRLKALSEAARLSTGLTPRLELAGSVPIGLPIFERMVHTALRASCIHGEWFTEDAATTEFIAVVVVRRSKKIHTWLAEKGILGEGWA